MNPLQDLVCEVCGKEPAIGVAASPLGPISHAYGKACLAAGAEPYGTALATAACAGGRTGLAEWAQDIVAASVQVAGKTLEQFDVDVAEAIREMNEHGGSEDDPETR